ncbi:MAG: prepilin-type N-terminal cleavage/methylation domain-containing protein [Gemmatimonadota bacterium]|nr:prepilin-type N-terminal cleavage/methylation domain-containing protein [Gemmatimonadota bacterium]
MRHVSSRRAGFTLAEILIAVVIIAIIGAAFTRLIIAQSRFFAREYGARTARAVARSSMNLMLTDLRMVQDSGGVDSVSSDGRAIRVIVPYAFGMACGNSSSATVVSLLPTDTSALRLAVYGGWAWRSASTGRYTIVTPSAPLTGDAVAASSDPDKCTESSQANIQTLTINGRSGQIVDLKPSATGIAAYDPVFLWQKVTYAFDTSASFPGLYGLYRTVSGGSTEEIMAPFASTARFQFYVPGVDTSEATVPALSSIRGVDILLNSLSPKPSNDGVRVEKDIVTAVFFKNTRSF